MAILKRLESNIELVAFLIENYIAAEAPTLSVTKTSITDQSYQFKYSNGLVVTVNDISSPVKFLINIIYPTAASSTDDTNDDDDNIQSMSVNLNNLGEYILPLDSVHLSNDIISNFNKLVSSKIKLSEFHKLLLQSKQNDDKSIPITTRESATANIPQTYPTARADPQRPADMPDFEDEYEIQSSHNRFGPSRAFPSIGDRDLNPPGIGRYPPMQPYIDPLHRGDDGGMYPTMDHPIFNGRGQQGSSSRLGVPPGARFDDPLSEDNIDAIGQGLPGNLRRGQSPSGGRFDGGFNGGSGFGGGFM